MAVSSSSVDPNDYDDLASSPPMLQRLTHGAAINVSTNLVPPNSGRLMCEGAIAGRELLTALKPPQEEDNSGEITPPRRPWRNTSIKNDVGYLKLSPERPPYGGSTEQQPEDARRATTRVAAEEESLRHAGGAGFLSRDQERSGNPPTSNKNGKNTPWCGNPNPKAPPPEEAPDTSRHGDDAGRDVAEAVREDTLVHRHEARQRDKKCSKLHGASVQHLVRANSAPYIARSDNDGTSGCNFQTTRYDDLLHSSDETTHPCQGVMESGTVAWPPSPPPVSNCSGTAANLPPRHPPTLQERRARSFSMNHRSASFVERQEFERLVKEHRREELVKAEEEARRKLASEGSRMNRTSRAILARSSSFCVGDGGRSSTARYGAGGRRSSVFERLARCASEPPFTKGAYRCDGASDEEWTREPWVGGGSGVGCGRQLFTPMINARSNLLALRMPRREEDGFLQQRLYRDGEEQLRRRERRIQFAEEALLRRVNSCHVNINSERVLARRSRSKILRFQSRMRQVLEVVDARGTGWLSFAGLESVLGECEMLPAQPPQEEYDDVLLAVWTALSEENPCRGGNGSRGGGGGDECERHFGLGQDEREGACGVPIDSLAALLAGVAAESYDCGLTDSVGNNFDDAPWSRAEGQKVGRKSLPSRPVNRRMLGGDERRRGKNAPEPGDVLTAVLQGNDQLEDLSNQLRDVFDTNRRRERACVASETRGQTASGVATGEDTGASTTVASPAQVAATAARFEEQTRAKERKIELLRRAEEARKKLSHPFEPSMATTATPKAAAVRRKAAARVERKKGSVIPPVECRDGDARTAEGLQTKKPDLRTTEEREVEEKCTFQPRLFQPLPISPPRYPAPRTTHRSVGVGGESSEGVPQRTAVDRATASWYAQINRLKAGRLDRLRRLEQKQAIESRSEPLPPSVQQLFHDAGIEIHTYDGLNDRGGQPRERVSIEKKGTSSRQTAQKKGDTQSTLSRSVFASPPRLRLEARLRARNRLKEKRSKDQARKTAEEDARRQKRKRVLTRACKRSAAMVGLEMALSAREAERELPSWSDPPVLIAEVEFVRQKCWEFLPLWADTRPREAVGELAERQRGAVVGSVVNELETSLADELQRACERMRMDVGLGRGQETENWAFGGEKARRDSDRRRSVPSVVIQVDVADTPLPETAAG